MQIAKNGFGTARPNPSVGAVIVHKHKIIGEGFTSNYGKNHAEVNAVNSVTNKSLLKEATIYVTLEPCSHFGKTPPCADLLVKHQFKNVVIGCVDTNNLVAGKGIERLQNAGINVIVGVLEDECRAHHKRFFTVQEQKRPYIILKWAETKDGFIYPETVSDSDELFSKSNRRLYEDEVLTKRKNEDEVIFNSNSENLNNRLLQLEKMLRKDAKPIWISNKYSQQLVHKLRAKEHAILVGTNTAIADNPKLNVRSWTGNNPVRIVIDRKLKINKESNLFDKSVKTIVLCEEESLKLEARSWVFDADDNVISSEVEKSQLIFEILDFSQNIAEQICSVLQKHNIQSVIIEGGTQTLQTFIDANLWDEALVFTGDTTFKKGIKAPVLSAKITSEEKIKNDILKIYTND